ncbi:hypothetical protein LT493_12290 [Streptomyces tricolor]|nr:hypothetical protein [Streptomyces tricolor]
MCGLQSVPAEAFTALIPALVLTAACHELIHRHLLAARRDGRALRHVVVVGEGATIDAVVGQLAQRTDHEYVVVGCCPVGEEEGALRRPRVRAAAPCGARDARGGRRDGARSGPDEHSAPTSILWCRARTCRASGCAGCPGRLHDRGCPIVVLPGIRRGRTPAGPAHLGVRPHPCCTSPRRCAAACRPR